MTEPVKEYISQNVLDVMKKKDADARAFDFTAVKNGSELLELVQDNALGWGLACSQYIKRDLGLTIDPDYLRMWFANAIEHSNDFRRWKREAAAAKVT